MYYLILSFCNSDRIYNKKSTCSQAIIENSLNSWNEAHERKMRLENSIYSSVWRRRYLSHYPMKLIMRYLWGQYKDNFLKYFFGDLEHRFQFESDLTDPTFSYLSGSFTFSKDVKLK